MHILGGLKKMFHVQSPIFGCDISDRRIRFALLKKEHGSLTLASFGTETIPEGVVSGGTLQDLPKATEIIRRVLDGAKGEKIRTPYVVASLPEPQCFLRIVQLPKLDTAEIEAALKWEIEANIPLPLADVYYDWEVAPRSATQDHLDILVAASPKSFVDAYLHWLLASGLKPVAFEVDALAMARSCISFSEEHTQSSMLIDIAQHLTTFIIYAGGLVRFTASLPINGQNAGGAEMKNFVKNLAGSARQYMDFFPAHAAHAHLLHAEVKNVLISGDDVQVSGLASALAMELGVSTTLANPWINILTPPLREVPSLPYKDSLGYCAALGLALRGHQESSAS